MSYGQTVRGKQESVSSALRDVPRWMASDPASSSTDAGAGADVVSGSNVDDDDNETYTAAGGTSNCSRLPVYVGEGSPVVMRRNHPGGKD